MQQLFNYVTINKKAMNKISVLHSSQNKLTKMGSNQMTTTLAGAQLTIFFSYNELFIIERSDENENGCLSRIIVAHWSYMMVYKNNTEI